MSEAPGTDAARRALARVERAWPAREGLAEALADCEVALAGLPADNVDERAALRVWIGRLLVASADQAEIERGVRSLEAGIAELRDAAMLPVAWMNHGSGLFRLGTPESLRLALDSYATAVVLLEGRTDAEAVNALGACWLNRGTGRLHLAEIEPDAERAKAARENAAADLERAVTVLSTLPESDVSARRNLAAAWAGLGLSRHVTGDHRTALEAHRQSVLVARGLALGGTWAESFGLAARLLNLAHAAGDAGARDESLGAAREALALAERLREADGRALDLALSARHAVCVALAGIPAADDHVSEPADLAEDGLALLDAADDADASALETGRRLYEFGAWWYRTRQPWFLAEFLTEHLGRDAGRWPIAAQAVGQARQDQVQRGFEKSGEGDLERSSEVLRSLEPVDAVLRARGFKD